MSILHSNLDAFLVAIPMIGLLLVCYFRLDELVGKPKQTAERRRQIAGSDASGRPICIDPDGKRYTRSGQAR